MPYGALYAAPKRAIEGHSESLAPEPCAISIQVSVIEPAYTKTPFDADVLEVGRDAKRARPARGLIPLAGL